MNAKTGSYIAIFGSYEALILQSSFWGVDIFVLQIYRKVITLKFYGGRRSLYFLKFKVNANSKS